MKSAYPKIFEPITIKRTTIKNRIAMTPMGTNYGETSGEMSNRHMNYSGWFQWHKPDPHRSRQLYAALLSVSRKSS